MNHAAIIQRESAQPYRNRSYMLSDLDDRHFDALNEADSCWAANGYCLDAIDQMPRGCMSSAGRQPTMECCIRGWTEEQHQQLSKITAQLIAEILAEEA